MARNPFRRPATANVFSALDEVKLVEVPKALETHEARKPAKPLLTSGPSVPSPDTPPRTRRPVVHMTVAAPPTATPRDLD